MTLLRAEAEDFLYMESDLLDRRDFAAWLKLFSQDAVYWLPMNENPRSALESSVLRDDMKTLTMRIHQLLHEPRYAQRPKSRTVHAVSNVRVERASQDGESLVRCNLSVTEMREGDYHQLGLGQQRMFSAHCEYLLRGRTDQVKIAKKKVTLVNRDTPIENLSFIL